MSTVFVGGSRRLSRLNDIIRGRLGNRIARGHAVLVGDAKGSDRAVQAYFAERNDPNVTVYCTNGECRNNVGGWPVRAIRATRERGFDFYALKDSAMAADAECGFMLWDGQSRGTLANVRRLVDLGKPVDVSLASSRTCLKIRTPSDLASLGGAPVPPVPRQRAQRTLFPGGAHSGRS